ncbi:MAG: hypothetical protein U0Q15_01230 [Kineosporiaceae bacterium]
MPQPNRPGRTASAGLVTTLSLIVGIVLGPVGLAALAAPAASAAPRSAAAVSGPVVLLGTSGLTWEDVSDATPTLATLGGGSVGTLAVRSVRATACPVDGWLAVGTGRRAADDLDGGRCRAPEVTPPAAPGGPATVLGWQRIVTALAGQSFDATPGLLATTLQAAGVPAAAVGPGAALALAGPDGRAPRVWPGLGSGAATAVTTEDSPDPAPLAEQVTAAVDAGARLVLVDIGGTLDDAAARAAAGTRALPHDLQLGVLDDRVRAVAAALPESATLIVAGLADDGGDEPRLQLLAAGGPGPDGVRYGGSLLGSPSTRQDGMAQATDLLPTLVRLLGVDVPGGAVGSPLVPVQRHGSDAAHRRHVLDLQRAAVEMHRVVPWFFGGFVAAQLVLFGGATLVVRRLSDSPERRRPVLRRVRAAGVAFAAVPAATFLANLLPWWRASSSGWAVTGAVALFTLLIAVPALLLPGRERLLAPFGTVGAATALVLGGDVLTGSHLVLSSLMGVQPLVAGRFYGFSNPGFALFATGCLLAAADAADALLRRERPRRAALAVAGIGVACVIVDGTPGLGSDFGGPPAILPAFAVLALLVAGVRLTWRRMAAVGGLTVAVLVALSLLDWARPATDRTHLGRFVQTVIDGGAWSVVRRKAEQNLQILLRPISLPVPVAVAFVVRVLARPARSGVRPLESAYERSRALRPALVAFAVLMVLGFALNDSGAAIPAVAGAMAVPLLVAVTARALELDDQERPPAVRTSPRPQGPPAAPRTARQRTLARINARRPGR